MRNALHLGLTGLLLMPVAGLSQERPEGWMLRLDDPGTPDSTVSFVTMEPGWHITTGPRVILYDPDMRASGTYQVQSTMHLFPGSPREAFGLFIGGRNLQEANQAYAYFLIRGDGHFLIKRREGTSTPTVHQWTKHDAITPMDSEAPVRNVLAVDVGDENIAFFVNGVELARVPKRGVVTNGIVGLRVNHRLNIHVEDLTITPTGP